MNKKNKKICIVTLSLAKGGAERSSALLSKMLNDLGYEIHIVTILPDIDYNFSGTLFNLGKLKNKKNTFFNRIKRLIIFKNYLKKQKFDVIVDSRVRTKVFLEFITTKFIYKVPTIYMIHNFETSKVFTKYNWLNTYLYKNEIMAAVSKAAKEKFQNMFNLNQIHTIYNGFDFNDINKNTNDNNIEAPKDYIIFYGRIDDAHKNLKLLIDAYKVSKLQQEQIKLLILGDGLDYNEIFNYVKQRKLSEHIIFKEFTVNPYPYVKKARFMMLSSRFEGFPMVIPEALSLGIPVISVDCQSGPNEVIKNGYNGLLVENYNEIALAEAMNSFIFDDNLYEDCKKNTKQSVKKFSKQFIAKDWEKLLNEILK